MEIQFLDFDEVIVMQGGVITTTNVATGEETTTIYSIED